MKKKKPIITKLHLTPEQLNTARKAAYAEYKELLKKTPWLADLIKSPDRYKYLGY